MNKLVKEWVSNHHKLQLIESTNSTNIQIFKYNTEIQNHYNQII